MNPSAEQNRQSNKRRRPLPATGLPSNREDRRASALLSALLHILLILLLIAPAALHTGDVKEIRLGAGGAGPQGGGGGGHKGTGGAQEHLTYVQVAAAPTPAVVQTPQPVVVPPPVVKPVPPPVVPPPQVTKTELVPQTKIEVKAEVAKVEVTAPVAGTGGGSGRDGTNGNGPGSGGGVGSGIGTGRGSANGPGTGGGNQANYPPSMTEMFIPPQPVPGKVHGVHVVAEFDVDDTGKVLSFVFTSTKDAGYDKRLDDVLKRFRFRPGTKPD
ncbi:MAG: hypothetical protein ABI442_18175, partial [Gemmatimonadaceae bacterium]